MPDYPEERLGELIALLVPPPQGWVQAAIELPRARAAIDELTMRATADERVRRAILSDLEQALRGAGVEPRSQLLDSLRARLSRLD
ncbi:MAG: hypothetical protein ACM3UX_00765 [Candidatus Woesearchaeota archaeon]